MIVTISVPNNTVKLQYAVGEDDGYEAWTTVQFGQIIGVQKEEADDENA